MGLAHCKGQAITLWVITRGATHLSANGITACGRGKVPTWMLVMQQSEITQRVGCTCGDHR